MFDWCRGIWDSLTLISHISNESIFMISMVGDNLDTTVRKLNSVLSLDNSIFILSLSLGKVSSILISSTIFISKWLRGLLLFMVWSWCRVVGSRSWGISNISWSSKSRGGNKECTNKSLKLEVISIVFDCLSVLLLFVSQKIAFLAKILTI